MAYAKIIDGRKHVGGGQYIGLANNSTSHQEVQLYLAFFLMKAIGRKVLAEAPIRANKGQGIKKFIPDVVIYRNERDYTEPEVIIEISDKSSKKDISKCKRLVKHTQNIKEAFVYSFGGRCLVSYF